MRKNILGPVFGVSYILSSWAILATQNLYEPIFTVRSDLNVFQKLMLRFTDPAVYSALAMYLPFQGYQWGTTLEKVGSVVGTVAYFVLWAGIGLVGEKIVRRLRGEKSGLENRLF